MYLLPNLSNQTESAQIIVANLLMDDFHKNRILVLEEIAAQRQLSIAELRRSCQWLKEVAGLAILDTGRACKLLKVPPCLEEAAWTHKLLSQLVPVEAFYVLDSTNAYLRRWAASVDLNAWQEKCCYAYFQTAGQGQWGRRWVAPLGHSMLCSMLWLTDRECFNNIGWAQWFSLITAEVLLELGVETIRLKWPNDLYVRGRKLGGILAERFVTRPGAYGLLVGCGINLFDHPFFCSANYSAISLNQVKLTGSLGRLLSFSNLILAIVKKWKSFLNQDLQTICGLSARWKRFDVYYKKQIVGEVRGKRVSGIGCSIDEHGALILSDDGSKRRYTEGCFQLKA